MPERFCELSVTKKKKPKKFRAVKVIKEMARQRIGAPPPTSRLDSDKRSAPGKHKPTLGRLLDED